MSCTRRPPSGSSGSEYSAAAQQGPSDSPTSGSGSSALGFEDNRAGPLGAEGGRETFLNAEAVRRSFGAPAPSAGPDSAPVWSSLDRMLTAQAATHATTQAAELERLRQAMAATQAADLEQMRQTIAQTMANMAGKFQRTQQQNISK